MKQIRDETMLLRNLIRMIICFSAVSAQAAGIRQIGVPADARRPKIDALMWTPCGMPGQDMRLFGITVSGVSECKSSDSKFPVIIISHGANGNFLNHHDTAGTLADSGFVVVTLNHPLDSDIDMTRARDASAFTERPTDIKRLIDYVVQSSPAATSVDSQRIGFFGFSRGGFTGLVLAGAAPDYPDRLRNRPSDEPRISSFVIVDPLSFFPSRESLRRVRSSIQLWGSQFGDQEDVTPERVSALASTLPTRPEFHVVPNSTHLSFVAPCWQDAAKKAAKICVDPSGFDRKALHKQFNGQVLAFFRGILRGR